MVVLVHSYLAHVVAALIVIEDIATELSDSVVWGFVTLGGQDRLDQFFR